MTSRRSGASSAIEPGATKLQEKVWIRDIGSIPFLLFAFSLFYFGVTLIRASEKRFWYDELFTVYLCRIPSVHTLWRALLDGADLNPLPFYLLTRGSERLLGEGPIASRMPAIVGFWILCLSLFWFVNRTAGLVAGFVAMALPVLTGAYYYAFEARPHAVVMGFCGLALVCWQMDAHSYSRRRPWLIAFATSLFGAFMMHCFALVLAVPFATAEAFRTFSKRELRIRSWIALAIPSSIACITYVPLFRAYRRAEPGTGFTNAFPPNWFQLAAFYNYLLTPAILLLLAALFIIAVSAVRRRIPTNSPQLQRFSLPLEECILGISFLAIPAFGIILGKVLAGPFFARYFMSAVTGASILLGFLMRSKMTASGRLVLALLLIGTLSVESAELLNHRYRWRVGETVWEPSSNVLVPTGPAPPLASHSLLSHTAKDSLPIVVADALEFPYLLYYAPSLTPRLYTLTEDPAGDNLYHLYVKLRKWADLSSNPEPSSDAFLTSHARFWFYGSSRIPGELPILSSKGAKVRSLEWSGPHFLAEMESPEHRR